MVKIATRNKTYEYDTTTLVVSRVAHKRFKILCATIGENMMGVISALSLKSPEELKTFLKLK